ncbi:tol-pal system protein YbgF [Pleionea sediminis]|uniref:tol-pal system protein YbgF n=1 Tax=Pleionea sediminis TaxID=2569479 RepID=UPI001184BFF7|nr:tol-pal system protein YbgF [Pleionea sediminis]
MKANYSRLLRKTALFTVLSVFSAVGFSQSVEERLERLEQMAESRGQLQADVMFQINAIQEELQNLRGQVEEHEYKLKQLQDRQRDLYKDIERRLSQLQNMGQVSSSSSSDSSESSDSSSNLSSIKSDDVHGAYQEIFSKVRAKKYAEAVTEYKAFLTQYPNSQYEASVHYWLGQIYFIQQNLDAALNEYKIVTSKHGNSSRAPDAMVKQGKVLVLQNKLDEAKAIFNKVIENYSGAPQQLAKNELQKLKNSNR